MVIPEIVKAAPKPGDFSSASRTANAQTIIAAIVTMEVNIDCFNFSDAGTFKSCHLIEFGSLASLAFSTVPSNRNFGCSNPRGSLFRMYRFPTESFESTSRW